MSLSENTRPHVVIVGGGIAGLAAAHRLVELSHERRQPAGLTLLESQSRLGGSIATEHVDGFVVESGPDSFISEKPWALKLCERIDFTNRLIRTNDGNRRTYVVHNGRLHPLPDGFLLLAPTRLLPLLTTCLFTWPGKLRMGLDLVLPRRGVDGDESLGSFVKRRLGSEALARVAQPLVGGIYTADPNDLSLAATMPRFLEMERQSRSVIWSMWASQRRASAGDRAGSGARWSLFVSAADGMQSLIEAISNRLPANAVQLGRRVVAVLRQATGWRVTLSDGEAIDADAVIMTVPAYQSARCVETFDGRLAEELRGVPYASSATVSLGYRAEQIPRALDGFGFVVPQIEGRSIIACTYSSSKFPHRAPAGHVLLRAFVGGALQPEIYDQDDEAVVANVRHELHMILGVTADPVLTRIFRHPAAMPQYRVGHLDRVVRIQSLLHAHPGLALAGNAYHGVGIPDCIHGGEVAAESVWGEIVRNRPLRDAPQE